MFLAGFWRVSSVLGRIYALWAPCSKLLGCLGRSWRRSCAPPGAPGGSWVPQGSSSGIPGRHRRSLGELLARPGGLLGLSWALLGVSWALLGPAWVVQAGSGRARGLPRRCLGPPLATLSGPDGATLAFQKTLKFVRFLCVFKRGGCPGDDPGHHLAPLGGPWSTCWRPGELLGDAGGFQGGSWGVLGVSWGAPGVIRGSPTAFQGVQGAPGSPLSAE